MRKDYFKKAGHRFRQGQPQWLFNQSQLFSSAPMAKGGAMAALSSPNGHFIKASPVWPLCQEQPNCNFNKASPNGNFIKQVEWQVYQGQPEGHFVQAAPVAILSKQMAVSSKPIAALPKPMAILSKPAATAIYQGQPQWQLYDGCSGKGKPLGLALGGPSRYCADRGRPRLPIDQSQLQPEGPTLRSNSRRLDPLLRRVSSLSAAGRPRF